MRQQERTDGDDSFLMSVIAAVTSGQATRQLDIQTVDSFEFKVINLEEGAKIRRVEAKNFLNKYYKDIVFLVVQKLRARDQITKENRPGLAKISVGSSNPPDHSENIEGVLGGVHVISASDLMKHGCLPAEAVPNFVEFIKVFKPSVGFSSQQVEQKFKEAHKKIKDVSPITNELLLLVSSSQVFLFNPSERSISLLIEDQENLASCHTVEFDPKFKIHMEGEPTREEPMVIVSSTAKDEIWFFILDKALTQVTKKFVWKSVRHGYNLAINPYKKVWVTDEEGNPSPPSDGSFEEVITNHARRPSQNRTCHPNGVVSVPNYPAADKNQAYVLATLFGTHQYNTQPVATWQHSGGQIISIGVKFNRQGEAVFTTSPVVDRLSNPHAVIEIQSGKIYAVLNTSQSEILFYSIHVSDEGAIPEWKPLLNIKVPSIKKDAWEAKSWLQNWVYNHKNNTLLVVDEGNGGFWAIKLFSDTGSEQLNSQTPYLEYCFIPYDDDPNRVLQYINWYPETAWSVDTRPKKKRQIHLKASPANKSDLKPSKVLHTQKRYVTDLLSRARK